MKVKGVTCGDWAYRKRIKVDDIPLDRNDLRSEKGLESIRGVGVADQSDDEVFGILAELSDPFQLIRNVRQREPGDARSRIHLHRDLWRRRSQQ